jgi:O-antigen ligase
MIGLWLTFVIYRFRLHRKPIMLMATSFVLIGLMLGLILLSPKNRERFKEAINYKNEYALSKKWGEKQMRFLMWSSATDLIKEKPLFGFGTGDVQDELEKHYVEHDYVSLTYWKNTRFNAHNQFMETALALGIIGLLVFVIGMIFGLKEAIRNKNKLYIVFVILFLGSCLTESMLERQNGIVFFAFFNSMLLVMESNKTNGIRQV